MQKRIKKFLKKSRLVRYVYSIISDLLREELTLTNPLGKGREQPVYIIRRFDSAGFFSNFLFVLGHIIYAEEHDFTPVVDMKHYPTPYNEKIQVNGTKNAWEYYFAQPTELCLHDAYRSRSIILSSGKMLFDKVPYYGVTDSKFPDHEIVEQLTPYIQKYISFRPELLQEAERMIRGWGTNILGVHIRGTDMKHTPEHPVPPAVEAYMEAIDAVIDRYEKIFLCTDEAVILKQMQDRYKDRIVFTASYRSEDGESIHEGSVKRKNVRRQHRYLNGREVLMDMLLLSKCNAIICGYSNVPYTAILLNGNRYDEVRLLENTNSKQ